MSYESKLFFYAQNPQLLLGFVNLNCVGYAEFYDLFNEIYDDGIYSEFAYSPINGEEFGISENEVPDFIVYKDRYGAELTYCTISELYEWLKEHKFERQSEHALRYLYKFCKLLIKYYGKNIDIVHYGY